MCDSTHSIPTILASMTTMKPLTQTHVSYEDSPMDQKANIFFQRPIESTFIFSMPCQRQVHRPQKLLNLWLPFHRDLAHTAFCFSGSIATPLGNEICPTYHIFYWNSWQFSGLSLSWVIQNIRNTSCRHQTSSGTSSRQWSHQPVIAGKIKEYRTTGQIQAAIKILSWVLLKFRDINVNGHYSCPVEDASHWVAWQHTNSSSSNLYWEAPDLGKRIQNIVSPCQREVVILHNLDQQSVVYREPKFSVLLPIKHDR